MGTRGEIFSTRSNSKSEKRTYFFNVKENRHGDIFLNIVESKKHTESDFERHQIVIFQEDMTEFLQALGRAMEEMKPGAPKRPPNLPRTRPSGKNLREDTNENSSGGWRRGPGAR